MTNSKLAIYGAIGANIAIAATKLVVAGITGSSAMLSEGIHSSVDTFNGMLLLVGIRLSQRPATPEHPFGHGKELYLWSLIAAVGIWLSHRFDMPVLDGAASLLIGVLLVVVATFLTWQSRDLLIGEGIRPETARAIRSIALAVPGVRDVGRILSMYVGPDDALVTMDLDFDEGTAAADAALAIADVERQVRQRFPMIKRLFVESGSAPLLQRWSRPDAIRTLAETTGTLESPAGAPAPT